MRIIGGRFKRARITAPKGDDVRPTTDRVREALFNVLQARFSFEGAAVLDLFCGTGALGLEALSRGAERLVFVEADPSVLRIARANALSLGVADCCTFVRSDAWDWLKKPSAVPFDLIFADPPYDEIRIPELPASLMPLLAPTGLVLVEHDARHAFEAEPTHLRSSAYGRTVVSMFGP